jgi:hypothetical protein
MIFPGFVTFDEISFEGSTSEESFPADTLLANLGF